MYVSSAITSVHTSTFTALPLPLPIFMVRSIVYDDGGHGHRLEDTIHDYWLVWFAAQMI